MQPRLFLVLFSAAFLCLTACGGGGSEGFESPTSGFDATEPPIVDVANASVTSDGLQNTAIITGIQIVDLETGGRVVRDAFLAPDDVPHYIGDLAPGHYEIHVIYNDGRLARSVSPTNRVLPGEIKVMTFYR